MEKKILHISDWHLTSLKEGEDRINFLVKKYGEDIDALVMTGDMLFNTSYWRQGMFSLEAEAQRNFWENEFVPMLESKYPKADFIAVPGNHDYCDYGIEGRVHSIDSGAESFTVGGIRYTGYRGIVKYVGAWNTEYSEDVHEFFCSRLDKDADVVITHVPAFMINNGSHVLHYGSKSLRNWLERKDLKIKAHLHGHAHEAGGYMMRTKEGIFHSNAADSYNYLEIDVEQKERPVVLTAHGNEINIHENSLTIATAVEGEENHRRLTHMEDWSRPVVQSSYPTQPALPALSNMEKDEDEWLKEWNRRLSEDYEEEKEAEVIHLPTPEPDPMGPLGWMMRGESANPPVEKMADEDYEKWLKEWRKRHMAEYVPESNAITRA